MTEDGKGARKGRERGNGEGEGMFWRNTFALNCVSVSEIVGHFARLTEQWNPIIVNTAPGGEKRFKDSCHMPRPHMAVTACCSHSLHFPLVPLPSFQSCLDC